MIDLFWRYLDEIPMDISDLKIFETVARCGGMKRAATDLHTVQSNVTARIKVLETDIGCALFDRHSRGVSLTPAGRRLLPYAEQAVRLLSDAKRAARDDGTPRGALAIGSLETTAALRLTPLLSRYAAENSEVDLTLHTGTTRELIAAVAEQRLDGAFVCGPATHPALEEQTMFREELVVLASPDVQSLNAAFKTGVVRTVVLRVGCSYRQMLETLLARRAIVVERQLEFGTLEAIFGCVGAGLGITLLPRALVGGVIEAGRVSVHRLPRTDAVVDTVFIRRRGAFASSALRAFLECAVSGFTPARAA